MARSWLYFAHYLPKTLFPQALPFSYVVDSHSLLAGLTPPPIYFSYLILRAAMDLGEKGTLGLSAFPHTAFSEAMWATNPKHPQSNSVDEQPHFLILE